jgi:hypothetical protein
VSRDLEKMLSRVLAFGEVTALALDRSRMVFSKGGVSVVMDAFQIDSLVVGLWEGGIKVCSRFSVVSGHWHSSTAS